MSDKNHKTKSIKSAVIALLAMAIMLVSACAMGENTDSASYSAKKSGGMSTSMSVSRSVSQSPAISGNTSQTDMSGQSTVSSASVQGSYSASGNSVIISGSAVSSANGSAAISASFDYSASIAGSGDYSIQSGGTSENAGVSQSTTAGSMGGNGSMPQSATNSGTTEQSASGGSQAATDGNTGYEINAYVDGQLYTTVYAGETNGYTANISAPEDITTNGNIKKYFYGWFTDEELTHEFSYDYVFDGDAQVYGTFIVVDENAFEYSATRRGVMITGLSDRNAKYVGVPAYIEGKKVETIGFRAFENSSLRVVYIENGVDSIQPAAFTNCKQLEKVVLPESLKTIPAYCFAGCDDLCCVKIPEGTTQISNYAFSGCERLTEATLGTNVGRISDNAFYGCGELTAIYYMGDVDSWQDIRVSEVGNEHFINTPVYYYSETKPHGDGNYWHYDEYGKTEVW